MTYQTKSPSPGGEMSCPLVRDHLRSQFCEVIPSTVEALNAIEEKVMAVVTNLACAPDDLLGVSLSLREALANAVVHGNENDPSRRVLVACFCDCTSDKGLLLVVRDEGPGFDPQAVPDPRGAEEIHSWHGRGIYLMRHFMDEVRYASEGREIQLRKRRANSRPSQRKENT